MKYGIENLINIHLKALDKKYKSDDKKVEFLFFSSNTAEDMEIATTTKTVMDFIGDLNTMLDGLLNFEGKDYNTKLNKEYFARWAIQFSKLGLDINQLTTREDKPKETPPESGEETGSESASEEPIQPESSEEEKDVEQESVTDSDVFTVEPEKHGSVISEDPIAKTYKTDIDASPYDMKGDLAQQQGWRDYKDAENRYACVLKLVNHGDRVVDVGCGSGLLYPYLMRNKKLVDYIGVDVSKKALGYLKKTYPDSEIVRKDVIKDPLFNKGDVVSALGVACDCKGLDALESLIDHIRNSFNRILVVDFWNKENFKTSTMPENRVIPGKPISYDKSSILALFKKKFAESVYDISVDDLADDNFVVIVRKKGV